MSGNIDMDILPVGLLMKEHRLIERMIALIQKEVSRLEKGGDVDSGFIENAADFISVYADACHHGKEEDFLFAELREKDISREHETIMDQLIAEHKYGRETVAALVNAGEKILKGEDNARDDVVARLKDLADFYPKHIDKEDHRFFLPVMEYLDEEEKHGMLKDFYEFDMEMIHYKYGKVVDDMENDNEGD